MEIKNVAIAKLIYLIEILLAISAPILIYKNCGKTLLLNSSYAKEVPARITKKVESTKLWSNKGYYCYEFILSNRRYEGTTSFTYVNCGDSVIVRYWTFMPSVNELYNPFIKDDRKR